MCSMQTTNWSTLGKPAQEMIAFSKGSKTTKPIIYQSDGTDSLGLEPNGLQKQGHFLPILRQ